MWSLRQTIDSLAITDDSFPHGHLPAGFDPSKGR
jgi:hypothetical protein